jgi:hypothetical protein
MEECGTVTKEVPVYDAEFRLAMQEYLELRRQGQNPLHPEPTRTERVQCVQMQHINCWPEEIDFELPDSAKTVVRP